VRAAALIACLLLSACDDGITPDCFEGSPMAIEVSIDPALTAPASPEWECTAGPDPDDPYFCYSGAGWSIRVELADLFVIRAEAYDIVGWWPWIGIDLDRRRARLCAHYYSDLGPPEDALRCDPPICAVSGTLTMSRAPVSEDDLSGIAVSLDVTLPDGATLTGSLRTP
jgi:hypothetical protein